MTEVREYQIQLIKYLQGEIDFMKDMWVDGKYSHWSKEGSLQLNAEALGTVKTMQGLIEKIKYDMGVEE